MIVCFMAAVEGKNFATMLIRPCFKGRINESGISLFFFLFFFENLVDLTNLKDFEFESSVIS